MKVCVLKYDCRPVVLRSFLDGAVIRLFQTDCLDVRRTREQSDWVSCEFRKIVVMLKPRHLLLFRAKTR
jgi:hypothetical protein